VIWQNTTGIVVTAAAVVAAILYLARVTIRGVQRCLGFFARMEKALQNVEAQLYSNGGSSLRDQTNRLEHGQRTMSDQLAVLSDRIAALESKEPS